MRKNNIFWIGYSDLMTNLFFIMLVLFVVTIGYLKYNLAIKEQLNKSLETTKEQLNKSLETTKEQLNKIHELQTAVQELPAKYFEYQPQYKRFKLIRQIQFAKGSSVIGHQYYSYLINVGNSITGLINKLKNQARFKKFNIKYLVVIEGMSSKDSYSRNFELSYKRALSLYRFWKSNGISFDDKVCEIQISGSGTEGIREYSGLNEYKNQQFLIQIIPKMGKIQDNEKR